MTYCSEFAKLQAMDKQEDLESGLAWRRTEEEETPAVFHHSQERRW